MRCSECDGTKFKDDQGLKICVECGTLIDDYVELQSQELFSELDISRLSRVKKQKGSQILKEASKSCFSEYETYNIILREWTKALRSLGASSHFEKLILELWVLYLQRLKIAFLDEQNEENGLLNKTKFKAELLLNKRFCYTIDLSNEGNSILTEKIRKATPHFDCFPIKEGRLDVKGNWTRVLLSLLYLAVLLAEEPILLMDILRWCGEGHIPYLSAHNLVDDEHDRTVLSHNLARLTLPSASEIKNLTESLVLYMNIVYLPVPPLKPITDRITNLLRLPELVGSLALEQLKKLCESQSCIATIGMELYAMGAVIFVLKAYFGINDVDEIYLSCASKTLNIELGKKQKPFFCFEDWERYINKLIWFCGEIHPETRMQCRNKEDFIRVDSKIYSKYLWSEGVWQGGSRTTVNYKENVASLMAEKILGAQNSSFDNMLNQPAEFGPTKEPFFSIIEQFIKAHDRDPIYAHQVKIGEELLHTEFSTLALLPSVKDLRKELKRNNSKVEIVDSQKEDNRNKGHIYVPNPKSRVSKIFQAKVDNSFVGKLNTSAVKLHKESDSLRWLVTVCSFFCGAQAVALAELVLLYENMYTHN